jgi:uncharacterized membrane protein
MKRLTGLDVIRGIGIILIIIIHSLKYFYSGITSINFDSPSIIISFLGSIGLWAGLFIFMSGITNTYVSSNQSLNTAKKKLFLFGICLTLLNFIYLFFLAPPNFDIYQGTPNYSFLGNLINNGILSFPHFSNIFRTTPLLILGISWIFLAPFSSILFKKKYSLNKKIILFTLFSFAIPILSVLRIYLYPIYTEVFSKGFNLWTFILGAFIEAYSPIIPFFAFLIAGIFIGNIISTKNGFIKVKKYLIFLSLIFTISGIAGIILSPGNIIKGQTNYLWASAITLDYGIFLFFVILGFIVYNQDSKSNKFSKLTIFLSNFGFLSLSIFVFEGIISSILGRFADIFSLSWRISIPLVSLFAFCNIIIWAIIIKFWKKTNYKYSLEHLIKRIKIIN